MDQNGSKPNNMRVGDVRPLTPQPGPRPDPTLFRDFSQATVIERPKTRSLWATLGLLLVLLAGASIYGYLTLQDVRIELSQVPGMLKSMSDVNGRLGTAEFELRSLIQKWESLDSRLTKLNRRVNVDFRQAQSHAEKLTAQLEQRLTAQWNTREAVMNARLQELETREQGDRTRLARFEDEVSRLRQDLASADENSNRQLTILNRRVGDNQQGLAHLAGRLETERVDFELAKGHVEDPTPDISVKLSSTDVRHQRFSGWVFFLPDGRTLWVHNQDVQRPIIFYSRQDGQRYEVVMTRIAKNSATGYLLLSGGKPSGAQTSAEDSRTGSEPAGQ